MGSGMVISGIGAEAREVKPNEAKKFVTNVKKVTNGWGMDILYRRQTVVYLVKYIGLIFDL